MYDVFEEAVGGVLDRRSFIEGCIRKGINENTASTCTIYSPSIEQLRTNAWKLRGGFVVDTLAEAYRDLLADLAQLPTMTELFHRGYNPRTLPPEFTTWFGFVAAERDLPPLNGTASRERIWGRSKPREATNATRKEGTG